MTELTARQIEVAIELRNGNRLDMIAHRLGLGKSCIRFHVKQLRISMKAKTTTQAVADCVAQGLID